MSGLVHGMKWCAAVVLLTASLGAAESAGWITNFEEAKKIAAEKKLPILMDFSGSDWCIWCQRLDSEVFAQKAFQDYAKDNLVLFLADFPMRAKQPDALKNQNRQLQSIYRVSGYPTVILVSAQGDELARTGYVRGGGDAYVEHLKGLLSGRKSNAAGR